MNTSEYSEKLMALANKELFGDEKMQLEKEIKDNPALAEEFKKHLLAQELLEAFISQDLKKKLNAFPLPQEKNESSGAVIKKMNPSRHKWAIAASIALILGVSSYLFMENKYSYQQLANNYVPQMQEVRGTNMVTDDILEKASSYITNNKSEMAITLLTSVTPDDDRFFMGQLLLGNAYYQTGNYSAASNAFIQSSKSGDDEVKYQGQYGFLLCELKLKSWSEENQRLLKELSENEFFIYKNEAVALSQKLKIAKFFN
jgi:uncharacterized protein YneF (UPF0154 family)